MCACDCIVLIGYHSSVAPEQCMMSPQLSEKGILVLELRSSTAVLREAIIPQRTGDCLLYASCQGIALRMKHTVPCTLSRDTSHICLHLLCS